MRPSQDPSEQSQLQECLTRVFPRREKSTHVQVYSRHSCNRIMDVQIFTHAFSICWNCAYCAGGNDPREMPLARPPWVGGARERAPVSGLGSGPLGRLTCCTISTTPARIPSRQRRDYRVVSTPSVPPFCPVSLSIEAGSATTRRAREETVQASPPGDNAAHGQEAPHGGNDRRV